MPTDVIVWGFGKLGRAAAEVCLDSPGTSLVAVVTGRPDEADGLPSGVRIVRTLAEAASERPALVLHCGHAVGEDLSDLLVGGAELGLDVVTSSGLFDPASQLSDEGARLHAAAVSGAVRIVTAGVQPGFVLDVLPATVLDLAPHWREVTVVKPSDARAWPTTTRHVLGIGESRDRVETIVAYPLAPSARLVAAASGCAIEALEETRVADLSDRDVVLSDEVIPAGMATGFQQRCTARLEDGRTLTLVWHPTVDIAEDQDLSLRLDVAGDGWLRLRLDGAFREDPYPATAQRMLHAGVAALRMRPGLHRAIDVGLSWPSEVRG